MLWKIIALGLGWRLARDDQEALYVVWHPKARQHFSGRGAWRDAVFFSIRAFWSHLGGGNRT